MARHASDGKPAQALRPARAVARATGVVARVARRSRGVEPAFTVLLGILLAACGEGRESPAWIALAPLARPVAGEGFALSARRSGLGARLDESRGGAWIDCPISGSAWQREPAEPDLWWVPRPAMARFSRSHVQMRRLVSGEREYRGLSLREWEDLDPEETRDCFCLAGGRLVLRLQPGSAPPIESVFSWWIERCAAEGGTRAIASQVVADGLAVWPGERAEVRCDLPPGSALRLATIARSLGRAGRVEFRVDCDGEPLIEHAQPVGPEDSLAHHVIPLDAAGRAGARLGFEVQGDPAATVFADPVIGPRAVGSYGRRPWPDARPDVVVFLADTFRADSLAAYGGEPGTTPNLDRLAERSVRFLEARAPSTWTLPSHGTLFTGLLPSRHGGLEEEVTFDPELVTLAERFRASGYRTGAVTDGLFVSRHYGMDQGFEWWEEREGWSLERTLSSALDFLDRDDGRPVFLFVHTYRTHVPYRTGHEESEDAYRDLTSRVARESRASGRRGKDAVRPFLAEFRALYMEGVRELDRQLGPWLAELEGRDLLASGCLVFTSDHGESFRRRLGHDGAPYEEAIRIPLLVLGRGLEPRDVLADASLVDLAPTLAALASLPVDPLWAGSSLLEPHGDRPLFSLGREKGPCLAVIRRGKKLLVRPEPGASSVDLLAQGARTEAYDLASDPAEEQDLIDRASWPGELARDAAPLWETEGRALFTARSVELSPAQLEELRALGYGD